MLKSSRDKNEGTYRSGDGGGGPGPLCDPGSGLLLLGGRERDESSARTRNGMKKKKKRCLLCEYFVLQYKVSHIFE